MEARRAFSLMSIMPRGAGQLDTPLHQRLEWRDEVIVPRGKRAQQIRHCNKDEWRDEVIVPRGERAQQVS
ncbi:hypothetical protein J6590_084800 [Homalodisca vitripennis]|nr:hypothetical protein J6590_084800 [Homalodisca vitripennis]